MHTTEQIGPKRHRTPEGYLLCEDVPIARTGSMVYGRGQTPVPTNDIGLAYITRDDATLFDPVTIMSFQGKPVTNDHPPGGVTPHNWQRVSVGTVLNVRRGKAHDADTLRADLLVTDAAAISAIESGKREVSAGYEADYETTGIGEGRQLHMVGNHIALVERGRCGPRCAIGDSHHSTTPHIKGKGTMPQRNTPTARRQVSDAQRAAILAAIDGPGENEDEDDGEEAGHVHVHLHNGKTADGTQTLDEAVEARFTTLEAAIGELTTAVSKMITGDSKKEEVDPEIDADGDDDTDDVDPDTKKTKTKVSTGDSAALQTSYTAMMADAEVLVPGFRVPTLDAVLDRKKTVDAMCAIRRRALDTVNVTTEGQKMLATVAGKTIDTMAMDCAEVATLFKSAAGAKRLLNNGSSTAGANRMAVGDAAARQAALDARPLEQRGARNVNELQEMNRKLFPLGTI